MDRPPPAPKSKTTSVFPYGLSGQELANRAITQAEKFGAKMMIARNVVRLECARRPYKVVLDNGVELAMRSVVIATGART